MILRKNAWFVLGCLLSILACGKTESAQEVSIAVEQGFVPDHPADLELAERLIATLSSSPEQKISWADELRSYTVSWDTTPVRFADIGQKKVLGVRMSTHGDSVDELIIDSDRDARSNYTIYQGRVFQDNEDDYQAQRWFAQILTRALHELQ